MSDIPRIAAAEAVLPGVLKLAWGDGYEGIVDLRGIIAEGVLFEHIRDPENFKRVQVERYGHSIYWARKGTRKSISGVIGCGRWRKSRHL